MNWSNWSEFAAMGGYAVYVWGSFGMAAIVMAGEVVALRARRKALRRAAQHEPTNVDFERSPHEA